MEDMSARANACTMLSGRLRSAHPRPAVGWRFFTATAAVLTAFATWVLVMGHAEARPEPRPTHPAHVLVSSLGGEFTVTADHAHVGNPSSAAHHEAFAVAVLPNTPAPSVAALAVVVAAVAAVGFFGQQVRLSGRSPPRGLAAVLTGQDLLTRFCLSRR
ncbi:hypothetical protein [Mycobacterium asiaticum]|nr:hypothetical protein [Mycobacterium asiaticum]